MSHKEVSTGDPAPLTVRALSLFETQDNTRVHHSVSTRRKCMFNENLKREPSAGTARRQTLQGRDIPRKRKGHGGLGEVRERGL